jgi:hypothetical protein
MNPIVKTKTDALGGAVEFEAAAFEDAAAGGDELPGLAWGR